MIRAGVFVGAAALAGCGASYTPTPGQGSPVDAAWAAGIAAKEATADRTREVLGWAVEAAGDRTSWRVCTSELACTDAKHDAPSSEVLALRTVGRAPHPSGAGEIDVVRITLRPALRTTKGGMGQPTVGAPPTFQQTR